MKMSSQTIGKYLIERELASGAMGTVYLGYDSMLGRHAAIKVIKAGMEEEYLRKRFFAEGQAVARLDHRNIIKIWGLDTDARNRPYIAMEYVEGEDLKTFIEKRVYLPFEQKLKIIIDVCMGLQHAHDHGVIHRDIKPANIRINRNLEPKILDFGLARQSASDMTRTNSPIGSPFYMSPEQWRAGDLDGRSDLFSIATVLYELITYVKTFEAESYPAIMNRITSEPHFPLTTVLPACAPLLSEILDHALAKDRDRRTSSCLEFANALKDFGTELPRHRENAIKEIDRIELEIDRCREKSTDLQAFALLDQSIFERVDAGKPAADGNRQDSFNEVADYGSLLHHHAQCQHQLDDINRKVKVALPLLTLFRVSQRQLEDGEFEKCEKTLQEVLKSSPGNPFALRMLETCRQVSEKRRLEAEKRARVFAMISTVKERLQGKRFSEASQVLRDILTMEPSHPEALQLRETVRQQKAIADSEKKIRIAELLEVCRDRFRSRDFGAARTASEDLLRLSQDN
jgi:serine/threonine protein kinase